MAVDKSRFESEKTVKNQTISNIYFTPSSYTPSTSNTTCVKTGNIVILSFCGSI